MRKAGSYTTHTVDANVYERALTLARSHSHGRTTKTKNYYYEWLKVYNRIKMGGRKQ